MTQIAIFAAASAAFAGGYIVYNLPTIVQELSTVVWQSGKDAVAKTWKSAHKAVTNPQFWQSARNSVTDAVNRFRTRPNATEAIDDEAMNHQDNPEAHTVLPPSNVEGVTGQLAVYKPPEPITRTLDGRLLVFMLVALVALAFALLLSRCFRRTTRPARSDKQGNARLADAYISMRRHMRLRYAFKHWKAVLVMASANDRMAALFKRQRSRQAVRRAFTQWKVLVALARANSTVATAFHKQRERTLARRAFVHWQMLAHRKRVSTSLVVMRWQHAVAVTILQRRVAKARNQVYTLLVPYRSTTG